MMKSVRKRALFFSAFLDNRYRSGQSTVVASQNICYIDKSGGYLYIMRNGVGSLVMQTRDWEESRTYSKAGLAENKVEHE